PGIWCCCSCGVGLSTDRVRAIRRATGVDAGRCSLNRTSLKEKRRCDDDDGRQEQGEKETLIHKWGCLGAELLRVPDRIRRDGMGGTARCGGLRASYLVTLRGVRALRWHMPNSWDNNGTPREVDGPA